ncbi:hypothetical protein CVD28_24955 [Bacillus sp. M6-12]|uniref:hypothetical protein n=1 Tax=Bacillus sp. M6-12 TaxID=2054166 RepID=UPI000C782B8D|nr:hypothetical protein [Bacillus sp. M6-12]PLS15086.1 hypothetical protein CVD28_24955 [Bacillus sp. M6-12]
MENLILTFWRDKEVHIGKNGHVLEGEVVGKVDYYRVEKYDTWTFYKNEKHYTSFKEAFKAVISKVKKYPHTTYCLYMHYFDKKINSQTSTVLFYLNRNKEDFVTVRFGYEKDFFCRLSLKDYTIEFDKGDTNEENTLLLDWLPKKREVHPTALQERIASFKEFNILEIDFKGIVKDERKEKFFEELQYCFEQINKVFPVKNFYPVHSIYFAKYKKARGKYGQGKISLNPDCYYSIRDTIYHEYGHFLYDIGLLGNYPYYYQNKVDRLPTAEIMDKIINILYSEKTLQDIHKRAEWRMGLKGKSSDNIVEIEKYRSKDEEYLLRPTEIFARLFEAYMLSLDKEKGESLDYKLDFTEEEIKKVRPLLQQYLKMIQEDYATETSTSI